MKSKHREVQENEQESKRTQRRFVHHIYSPTCIAPEASTVAIQWATWSSPSHSIFSSLKLCLLQTTKRLESTQLILLRAAGAAKCHFQSSLYSLLISMQRRKFSCDSIAPPLQTNRAFTTSTLGISTWLCCKGCHVPLVTDPHLLWATQECPNMTTIMQSYVYCTFTFKGPRHKHLLPHSLLL